MAADIKESPYQRWHRKNKEDFNKRRRERYSVDKKYRNKQLEMARRRRLAQPPKEKSVDEGLTTSEAGQMVGRKAQTLLLWEKIGLIPAPLKTPFRRYTEVQVNLMALLAEYMNTNRVRRAKHEDEELDKLIQHIREKW